MVMEREVMAVLWLESTPKGLLNTNYMNINLSFYIMLLAFIIMLAAYIKK